MGPAPTDGLLDALTTLRAVLTNTRLALETSNVGSARAVRDELVAQLDDHLLPRLRELEAPLLAVVGGSTGAGKSTLVNSIVGAEVSAAGVLRPTTRSPALVCNPADVGWFEGERILPGLARTTGAQGDPSGLSLVTHDGLPPGLALLDAPDIDSVVAANRRLASQLLAAADLWLFVTTAARYADAVPWELLQRARARGTALALVLDRVPPGALQEVPRHLAEMLVAHGLERARVFVVPEVRLEQGLLPRPAVAEIDEWLRGLAADADERARVVRTTLEGALDSLDERVDAVVTQARAQVLAVRELEGALERAYARERTEIEAALSAGTLLRGEVLARWHETVGTGDIMRSLESRIGRLRDRVREVLLGESPAEAEVRATLAGSVETVVLAAADRAAETAAEAWRATPAGAALIAPEGPRRAAPELATSLRDEVHAWQRHVLELVRAEGASKRAMGRVLSLGVNAVGAALMVAVFAQTGGLTGAELAVAGGTATVSQKLLEALFGDQAVRTLTASARDDLLARIDRLLDADAERFRALVRPSAPPPGEADALLEALGAVRRARR